MVAAAAYLEDEAADQRLADLGKYVRWPCLLPSQERISRLSIFKFVESRRIPTLIFGFCQVSEVTVHQHETSRPRRE